MDWEVAGKWFEAAAAQGDAIAKRHLDALPKRHRASVASFPPSKRRRALPESDELAIRLAERRGGNLKSLILNEKAKLFLATREEEEIARDREEVAALEVKIADARAAEAF